MDKDEVIEELMDLKIKLAMINYSEMDGKALLEENKKLNRDEQYSLKSEVKAKFIRRLNSHYYGQKGKEFFYSFHRVGNKVAVILLIIMASLWISMFTVEAVRTRVLNLMLDIQEEYTNIHLKEKENNTRIESEFNINWENAYAPHFIPEGYTISNLIEDKNLKTIQYSNIENSMIIFQQYVEGSSINIDTEDADVISNVTVQEAEGMLVVKGDVVTVAWSNDYYILLLYVYQGDLSNEEVLEIAESVVLIK